MSTYDISNNIIMISSEHGLMLIIYKFIHPADLISWPGVGKLIA